MATQKLQVGRALQVIISDNAEVPFPAESYSGTNSSVTANKLVLAGATFITRGVQVGDIIYNITDGTAATVTKLDSETTLSLNANIFAATSKAFVIYQGKNNDGCVLYVGGTGNLVIKTVGGDTVTLVGVPTGAFIPVHVKSVLAATTATSIVALW